MVFFLFSDYPKSAVGENGDFPEGFGFHCYFLMENFSLVNSHNLLGSPLIHIQNLNTNFHLEPASRKAEILYQIECDVGANKNAEQAFSMKRLSSHSI